MVQDSYGRDNEGNVRDIYFGEGALRRIYDKAKYVVAVGGLAAVLTMGVGGCGVAPDQDPLKSGYGSADGRGGSTGGSSGGKGSGSGGGKY